MEDLDLDGLFWLEESPEERVGGHLRFNARSGASLDLIGTFDGDAVPEDRISPVRIHGVAGNKLVTLDSCLQTNRTLGIPGSRVNASVCP